MTEEIIIDGIDVSGCSLLNKKIEVCMYNRETCNGICDYGCYARNEIIERLKQENERLKEKNKEIIKDYEEAYTKQIEYADDVIKLTHALEEIREIVTDIIKDNGRHNLSDYSSPIRIEKIINEVLNG